jgi:hypothetical protein
MPQVLTTNALIKCPHGGDGHSVSTTNLWLVNGGTVLVENDTGFVTDCPISFPCKTYVLQSMGLNATRVSGRRVVLVTDFNVTNTGVPLIIIEFHKVKDNTSPAPIADGQPAPPLPPEIEDDHTRPVVTASPTVLGFDKSTNSPPSNPVAFTLTAEHPMQFILMQLDEPEQITTDRTTVQPPGMTLSPSGGVWNVSPLTINLNMTAAFMATLAPLKHRFYMIGVNKRGLSAVAEVVLTVVG